MKKPVRNSTELSASCTTKLTYIHTYTAGFHLEILPRGAIGKKRKIWGGDLKIVDL